MTEAELKHCWKKVQIVGNILTPIVIAVGTFYINHQINQRSHERALQQDRLSRLALIPSFIDALTGANEKQRVLAVRVISRVFPEDAPALLDGVVESQPNSPEAEAAAKELDLLPARKLAARLYAPELSERTEAFEQILRQNIPPSHMTKALLDQIASDPYNLNGTANAWRVLGDFPAEELRKFQQEVQMLALITQENGPQTTQLAKNVQEKLLQD